MFHNTISRHLFQCIHEDAVCNKEYNCPDGADENETFCEDYECPVNARKCADGLECVKDENLCDGVNTWKNKWPECNDESDENDEFCAEYCHKVNRWKCAETSLCIKTTEVSYLLCQFNALDVIDSHFSFKFHCHQSQAIIKNFKEK